MDLRDSEGKRALAGSKVVGFAGGTCRCKVGAAWKVGKAEIFSGSLALMMSHEQSLFATREPDRLGMQCQHYVAYQGEFVDFAYAW